MTLLAVIVLVVAPAVVAAAAEVDAVLVGPLASMPAAMRLAAAHPQ